MAIRKVTFYSLIMILATGCSKNHPFPKEKYYPFNYSAHYSYSNDTLNVVVKNPLLCPLRILLSSPDKSSQDIVEKFGTLTLKEKSDTIIKYYLKGHKEINLNFISLYGDLNKEITKEKFSLPFPKNRSYKIIQGNNGSYSHNTDFSRYAIDFSLKINDTVCSAGDGYIVGVVKDYEFSGTTLDWINLSNYITIYHPQSGFFTEYAHLNKNGSFVKVGDTVLRGQPIGLSGKTGYTTVPHLHFNVLIPDKNGLISTASEFEEGYKGSELIENTIVNN